MSFVVLLQHCQTRNKSTQDMFTLLHLWQCFPYKKGSTESLACELVDSVVGDTSYHRIDRDVITSPSVDVLCGPSDQTSIRT
jgi:hypothetical protein